MAYDFGECIGMYSSLLLLISPQLIISIAEDKDFKHDFFLGGINTSIISEECANKLNNVSLIFVIT